MKRVILTTALIIVVLIFNNVVFAKEAKNQKIFMNGKEFKTTNLIVKGSTMVPLVDVFKVLGVKYETVKKYNIIMGTKEDKLIVVDLEGKHAVAILGLPIKKPIQNLDSYKSKDFNVSIIKGKLFLPLKTLVELMGDNIKYDSNKKIIYINTKKNDKGNVQVKDILEVIDLVSEVQADISDAVTLERSIKTALDEGRMSYPKEKISTVIKVKSSSFTINGYDFMKNEFSSCPEVYGLKDKNRGWNITLDQAGNITVEVVDDINNPRKVVKLYPLPEKWDLYPYSMMNEKLKNSNSSNSNQTNPAELSKEKVVKMTIKTSKGDIEIALYSELMPITVENFQSLVKQNFYKGLTFHRVEDWVIQGGDPKGDGTGGSSKTIKLETNNKLRNLRGAIAMARASDPDSASSQFYILKTDAAWLDGQYAVFGRVLSGMEIVDKIEVGDKITNIEEVSMHNDK